MRVRQIGSRPPRPTKTGAQRRIPDVRPTLQQLGKILGDRLTRGELDTLIEALDKQPDTLYDTVAETFVARYPELAHVAFTHLPGDNRGKSKKNTNPSKNKPARVRRATKPR